MSDKLKPLFKAALAVALAGPLAACGAIGSDDPNYTPTVGNRTPILGVASENRVDPALQGVAVVIPPALSNSEWSQPGMNASKSVGNLGLSAHPDVVWKQNIEGTNKRSRLAATPVIAEGRLFVADTDGVVHAYDAASGQAIWTHKVEASKDASNAIFGGGVAVQDGVVYATNGSGDVEAIDAATGKSVWKVRPAGPLRGAPTLANNNVYVMTQDNQIYALAQANGTVRWTQAASLGQASIYGVAAPAAAQATVIAGYSTGELTAYRFENGTNLWSDALSRTSISTAVSTLTDIDANPVIDRGRVYAVGKGGRMASYELVTGQRIWELNVGGIATPAIAGEWLFVLTDDDKLFAIARNSGRIRWISQLPPYADMDDMEDPISWTGPLIANNQLIVVSTEGHLLGAELQEGALEVLYNFNTEVSLPPVIANDMLYILTDNGELFAMR